MLESPPVRRYRVLVEESCHGTGLRRELWLWAYTAADAVVQAEIRAAREGSVDERWRVVEVWPAAVERGSQRSETPIPDPPWMETREDGSDDV